MRGAAFHGGEETGIMKKFFYHIWDSRITLLCTAVIAVLALLAWQNLTSGPYPVPRAEYAAIEGSPDYNAIIGFRRETLDWQPYDYPVPPPLRGDTKTVYLSWQMPETLPPSVDHILLTTTNQDVYVYLDDDLVYIHGNWDSLTDSRGRTMHFIHIKESFAGKRLTVMLHSGYRNWLGSIDYFLIGGERTLIRKVTLADAIFIASLSIALSLIVFLVMDLVWRGVEGRRKMHLYLIAFLVSFILWTTGISSGVRQLRKKERSCMAASWARTPPMTSVGCGMRASRRTSRRDPAPALGSQAPKTTRSMREARIAPAHIVQGSRVTMSVQPVRRQVPLARPASRRATISA